MRCPELEKQILADIIFEEIINAIFEEMKKEVLTKRRY